jgi:hypothetical protein
MLRNKPKASYIGYTRLNTPEIAGGVWYLNHQATEAQEFLWPGQALYRNTGDNLTGWTNSGANSSGGTINVSGTQYCYINPLINDTRALFPGFTFKSVTFEAYISAGVMGFSFGHSNAGRGPILKLDARGGSNYTGLLFQNSWGVIGKQPTGGFAMVPNTWTTVRIEVNNAGRCDWYTNEVYRDRQPVLLNGRNIGILGFGGGGSIRNIRVNNGFG